MNALAITLRLATPDDAAAVAEIYAPFVGASVISLEYEAPTAGVMRGRILETLGRFPWLIAQANGRVVGYVYAGPHRSRAGYQWAADVTVYLTDGYRGQGLGRRLYAGLFALLKEQGYRSLFAGITLPNDASVGLHRAMGMNDVGIYRNVAFKFGAWRDTLWMGLAFDDDRPPARLIPFGELKPDVVARYLG